MRPIDYDPQNLPLPDGWAENAAALRQAVLNAPDDKARAKIIEDNQIWSQVKSELKKLSFGKCWYTESLQIGTDVDVDHFRPKKRVAERCSKGDAHPGYWWLAYELSNYRYSCIFANRYRRDVEADVVGGKADCFPIQDEAHRAMGPDADWESEKPLLVDPCKADEVALISFKADGEAFPSFSDPGSYKYRKAELSIKHYNINHTDFVRARIELRDKIEQAMMDALRYFNKLETGDADHARAYGRAIQTLRELRRPSSQFSGFCTLMTDAFRGKAALDGVFR